LLFLVSFVRLVQGACPTPASVQNFQPPPYVPPLSPGGIFDRRHCSFQDISNFFTSCLDVNATPMTCQTNTVDSWCRECLDPPQSSTGWGPLIERPGTWSAFMKGKGIVSLNIAGCAHLMGHLDCAKAYEAASACDSAACDQVCPVTDEQSFMDWQKCVQTAEANDCKAYASARDSECSGDGSVPWPLPCFDFMTFQAGYERIAPMFCPSPPVDEAGSPSSDSGSQPDAGDKPGAEAGDMPAKSGCNCNQGGGGLAAEGAIGLFAVAAFLRRRLRR
jgi:hypothetical protein